jgi:hypothetical protein
MNPTPLPEPLAAPVHIVPPWLIQAAPWLLLAAAFLALVLFWLWWHRGDTDQPAYQPGEWPVPRVRGGLAERLRELSRRFLELGQPREGCHALAAELKTHLEHRSGLDVEEMTVDEIRGRFRSRRVGEFMVDLRERQYGRTEPGDKDLEDLTDRAVQIFSKSRNLALKKGR